MPERDDVRTRITRAASASRRGERGAALVEFAIVLPLLVLFLFAIVDFGFVYSDWSAVRQGGSDGLRQALVNTKPPAPGGTWTCPTPDGFNGAAPAIGSDAMNMVCFTKSRVGLDPANTRVKITFATSFVAGQPVKICVQYKESSRSGVLSWLLSGRIVSTTVESLIEQDQAGMTSVEEKPVPGGPGWPASCGTL